ncbi:hypothetical protein MTR67_039953 [Solanum verrucosum]|uniref:ABC transporter domain-containing protein n=1 Tax=Solanum verrucosum TaxID=315347 RepID=A0AAF0UHS1_SOLVR|nr:hypothetical protein MTR67_039953 [Solanum verrucosum]
MNRYRYTGIPVPNHDTVPFRVPVECIPFRPEYYRTGTEKAQIRDAADAKSLNLSGGSIQFENVHFREFIEEGEKKGIGNSVGSKAPDSRKKKSFHMVYSNYMLWARLQVFLASNAILTYLMLSHYLTERKILDGISFIVPAGKSVAIVGTSGSGKSTILRLLFRFFDTHSGNKEQQSRLRFAKKKSPRRSNNREIGGEEERLAKIKIDGQDIRKVTLKSLRKSIGVVPQDTVLFNDTIFHNIRYGRLSASEEEVYNAARQAAIHDTIIKFPQKYATVVGERGLKLSGGEKQRVALARAFLKAPAILLCDEATSALDSTTESEILSALKSLANNRTAVFIAHRLTTAMQCDEVIVLENGKVVEQGPHEFLLSRPGRYAQLWSQQNTVDGLDAAIKLNT